MEITFPYAHVFVDDSNLLSVFFRHDAEHIHRSGRSVPSETASWISASWILCPRWKK